MRDTEGYECVTFEISVIDMVDDTVEVRGRCQWNDIKCFNTKLCSK